MKLRFLFLFAVLGMVAPANLSAQDETYGTMMVVKGDIKVLQSKGGKTESAKVGFKVYSGDTITAGADSRAKIVMSDKNVINISPDSKMTIEKYQNDASGKNVELKVDYGKVRASVEQKYDGEKNKFNVKTPTAVAGVRGTDFMAGFNAGTKSSTITTFSGVVAVGQPGPGGQILNPVFVKPGQTTNVSNGKAPEPPKQMPKEELNKQNSDTSADTAKDSKKDTASNGGDNKQEKKDEKKEDKKDQQADKKDQPQDKKDQQADRKDQPGDKPSDKPGDKKDPKQSNNNGSGPDREPASPDGPGPDVITSPPVKKPELPPEPPPPPPPPPIVKSPSMSGCPGGVCTGFQPPSMPTPPPQIPNILNNSKSRVIIKVQ